MQNHYSWYLTFKYYVQENGNLPEQFYKELEENLALAVARKIAEEHIVDRTRFIRHTLYEGYNKPIFKGAGLNALSNLKPDLTDNELTAIIEPLLDEYFTSIELTKLLDCRDRTY